MLASRQVAQADTDLSKVIDRLADISDITPEQAAVLWQLVDRFEQNQVLLRQFKAEL